MTTDELLNHELRRNLITHDLMRRLRDEYDAGIGYRQKLQQRKSYLPEMRKPWWARLWKWVRS